ncbi:MAG: dipeptidase [Eubacteriales bacterium]|nr:dipeptidase [Eubacteriales bacterium]
MLICDSHCDTLYKFYTKETDNLDITPEKLKQGGVSLQTCAMYVGSSPKKQDILQAAEGMVKIVKACRKSGAVFVDDPKDIEEGKIKYLLSVEGGEIMEDDISSVEYYRNLGVRMASLTWNYDNKLASCHVGDLERGLTPTGKQIVKEFNRLKIAVDLSHINEKGFWDVLGYSQKPPMASHSCAKAICNHSRNLSDTQLRELFNAGGFVGLNFYPRFLNENSIANLNDVLRHIVHMYKMGGDGKVGFGSDFDGIEIKTKGIKDPTDYPALLDYMRQSGEFSNSDIENIAGRAFINYFKKL